MHTVLNKNKATFLVIDDEPDILDAIARLFRKDYDILTAQNVTEAWELIKKHPVQVVMTDQRMPKMSGIEFLAELRETHPHIVRVLFTGYSNISDVIDAINEGHVYRYISKPWKPAELRVFVAQAFEYYNAQREREDLMCQLHQANETLERQNTMLSAANEELKMLDRVKNVFMEVVSHELNTPIAIVFGYTFLLRKELNTNLSSVAGKALAGIDSSAVRLKNISNRIFKMLNDDGVTPTLDLEWIDLQSFTKALYDQVDPFLQKRHQTLEISVAPTATRILVDKDKLNDVCMSLLMNAIKFSYDDRVINLDIAPDKDNSDQITITVRDTGIGINDDDLAQIFNIFFSTFNTGNHSSGQYEFCKRGIGLGLAVAKRFAEMHGGYIEVDSTEGVGSKFTVHLPIKPDGASAAAPFPGTAFPASQHASHH